MSNPRLPKRPKRQGRGDRLISADASKAEVAVDHAVAPFDRIAEAMELKWGIDRLPALVPPKVAARYGEVVAELNEAIRANDPAAAVAAAETCIKGLHRMDQLAEEAGHPPADARAMQIEVDGYAFAIMEDANAWKAIKARHPNLLLFTKREVGIAVRAYMDNHLFEEVREHFPEAKVTAIHKKGEIHDDPIEL